MIIPIVFSTSNYFVPYLGVSIKSLINNKSEGIYYKIYIFHEMISETNKKLILNILSERNKEVTINFIKVTNYLKSYKLKGNLHIGVETYYRFLIMEILKEYEKVLYFDSDIIFLTGVEDLYRVDICNDYLAAVRDVDFIGQLSHPEYDTEKYARNILKIEKPVNYFQAGVLLLNIKKLQKDFDVEVFLEYAQLGSYRYMDQDVLNIFCQKNVKFLDMKWNFMVDAGERKARKVFSFLPEKIKEEYKIACENAKIVHFAGDEKPWSGYSGKYSDVFWKTADQVNDFKDIIKERYLHYCRNEGNIKNRVKKFTRVLFRNRFKKVKKAIKTLWK